MKTTDYIINEALNNHHICDKVCEDLSQIGFCKNCHYQETQRECVDVWLNRKLEDDNNDTMVG